MSFWLDDVPPPDSSFIAKDIVSIALKDTSSVQSKQKELPEITHPPAEEGSCNNCHDIGNSFALTEKPPKLCYTCHDDFRKKYKVLHGPIYSGSCTACHDPHKSTFKPLLNKDGQALCYFCHSKEAVLKNEVHSTIEETKCWDCHNPHGGNDRTFIK